MNNPPQNIRLDKFQYEAIIYAFKNSFLNEDGLWLFGSRINPLARGGDIDLYIETHASDVDDAYNRESKFIDIVWEKIGEQKIDVVLNILNISTKKLSIYQVAKTEGVRLV